MVHVIALGRSLGDKGYFLRVGLDDKDPGAWRPSETREEGGAWASGEALGGPESLEFCALTAPRLLETLLGGSSAWGECRQRGSSRALWAVAGWLLCSCLLTPSPGLSGKSQRAFRMLIFEFPLGSKDCRVPVGQV